MAYSSDDLLKVFVEDQALARKIIVPMDDKESVDVVDKLIKDKYIDGVIVTDEYMDLSSALVTDAGLKYYESHKNN